jgi:hypothetical protein
MEFEPMITYNPDYKPNPREKLLEMRIDYLQDRVRHLEEKSSTLKSSRLDGEINTNKTKSSFLVLPVTYSSAQEYSPKLEIVSRSSTKQSNIPVLLDEQQKTKLYETIV